MTDVAAADAAAAAAVDKMNRVADQAFTALPLEDRLKKQPALKVRGRPRASRPPTDLPRAHQVYADVVDEGGSADATGYVAMKTISMDLAFDRLQADWMLFDAQPLKGEAAGQLITFSAFGRKPRRYDFADDLSASCILPFSTVKVKLGSSSRLTSCIYGHAVLSIPTSALAAVVFNINSATVAEVSLDKISKVSGEEGTTRDSSQSALAASAFEVTEGEGARAAGEAARLRGVRAIV